MQNNQENTHFYAQLTSFKHFSDFSDPKHYQPLPHDWYVVISDIEGSTQAIDDGRYRDVNALGAASIVALINAVLPIKIPYVFGGDGATLCIPNNCYHAIASALVATAEMAQKTFNLTLRIGMVPMRTIHQAGYSVSIGKYQPHPHYQQSMFLGDGISYAESLIKEKITPNPYHINPLQFPPDGSFSGFECRWNEIPSPHEETVAILIQAIQPDQSDQQRCYQTILQQINQIYGEEDQHHPIREKNMQLTTNHKKLRIEQGILGYFLPLTQRLWNQVVIHIMVRIGRYLMNKGIKTKAVDWGKYKQQTVMNTDYRKFDELLRMVISGTQAQRKALESYLSELEQTGDIHFGIQSSDSALMTCLIFNYDTDHVHFLDGAQGGYAMAAKVMKQKIAAKQSR